MHAGDMFANKGAPFMDASNGGSGVEYPKTLAAAAKGIHGVDIVIPGHSAVTNWSPSRSSGNSCRRWSAPRRPR